MYFFQCGISLNDNSVLCMCVRQLADVELRRIVYSNNDTHTQHSPSPTLTIKMTSFLRFSCAVVVSVGIVLYDHSAHIRSIKKENHEQDAETTIIHCDKQQVKWLANKPVISFSLSLSFARSFSVPLRLCECVHNHEMHEQANWYKANSSSAECRARAHRIK